MLVEKMKTVDTKLRTPRPETTFPLTPTHRKELRNLRDENIGNLNERLRAIRELKFNEFMEKHKEPLEKMREDLRSNCETLNENWEHTKTEINKILEKRRELEETMGLVNVDLDTSSFEGASLKDYNNRRGFSVNDGYVIDVAKKEFETQYGEGFKKVKELISDVFTKYEEAINFGDLNIVKQLYYDMKDGTKFLKQISEMKIN